MNVDVKKIAKDETKGTHIQDRTGDKDTVKLYWMVQNIEEGQHTHERIEKQDERPGTHDELQREKLAPLPILNCLQRMSHMHKVGLKIAFDPARTLKEPAFEARWCLFIGCAIKYRRFQAILEIRKPNSQSSVTLKAS